MMSLDEFLKQRKTNISCVIVESENIAQNVEQRELELKPFFLKCSRKMIVQFLLPIYREIISTDEDPGLRIESFTIIKIHGVSTK